MLTLFDGEVKLKMMTNLSIRLSANRRIAQESLRLRKESSGQALLIVLLIMAVALTIGLSVISRSVTDIRISQQSEEAARAYSAAEAGIEEALVTGTGNSASFSETGAAYQTAVAGFGEGTEFVFPQQLIPNEIYTLYLATYTSTNTPPFGPPPYGANTIDLCWGGNAAVEASLYYSDAGGYKVARYAVDPQCPSGGTCGEADRSPGFDSPDIGGCADLAHKKTLNFPAGTLLFLRIRVFYENTRVGFSTGGPLLPSQGNRIESTGTAGQSTRKVEVVRFNPAPPEIFDFALYSGSDLKK